MNLWWQRIKATYCIIKYAIIRGNITWRSFALRDWAYKQKAHGNLCFPLRRAYLYFYVFTFMQESKFFSLFLFIFSWGEYISSWIWVAWVIIVDINLEVNMLGGETISPYLSICLAETFYSIYMLWVFSNHRRLNDGWVCGLAKKAPTRDTSWKYDKLQLHCWLRA